MKNRFIRNWFAVPANYTAVDLRKDITSGLTVAILLIPQAMAYALLAGLPAVYGLYASMLPLLFYALVSSTPHVSVGPTALASILTISSLRDYNDISPEAYLNICFLLAGLTGIVQLCLGLLRLGSLVNFLSRPVISGFVSAAAVLILFSQLKTLLGLNIPRTAYFHETAILLFRELPNIHILSAIIGISSLFLLYGLRQVLKGWPIVLLFIISTTALTAWQQWQDAGLKVLENVPNGLPAFSIPIFSQIDIINLLPAALVLGFVSFVETLSIGKTFQDKHDYYQINPNRELVALGISKVIGSFFQSMPTSASFSRSAVGEQAEARTALSSITSIAILAICAIFFMHWFYYLPMPVLAAIIMLSVLKLLDIKTMLSLWQLDKKEWLTLIVTFFVTLFGSLQLGIAAGVLLSLSFVVMKSIKPHLAELGRLPHTNAFRNIERFPYAQYTPEVLIVRFDAELFFGNATFFKETLCQLIRKKGEPLRLLIVDAHTIHDIDSSGAYALNGVIDFLAARDAELYLAGAIGPVRDKLYRFGIMDRIGCSHQFLSIQSALDHFHKRHLAGEDWERPAVQHD